MASNKVSVTVKYSKPGTQPPIYLAGSFSDPQWQPQEMEHSPIGDNEYEFKKEVEVEEGKEFQYKFRIGEGDWWTLEENSPTGVCLIHSMRLFSLMIVIFLYICRKNTNLEHHFSHR